MNRPPYPSCITLLCAGLLGALSLSAAVPASEADRLGKDLMPLGGERAGSADGVIPAWEGGITQPPAGYQVGMQHPDPFPGDQPQFIITAANMAQYGELLSEGHRALLRTYPDSYKMPVYQTRRTASYPQAVYDAVRRNAVNARLVGEGAGVVGASMGSPFPIPQNGYEVIWNHLMRYRGQAASRTVTQAAPTRRGDYTLVEFQDEFMFPHASADAVVAAPDETQLLFYLRQTVTAPARLAGSILLVHETLDQVKEPRRAWTYNVGQRRVRRAPNVAYDNPGTASDGMRTSDQLDMFNGALDRYEWQLIGKKELLVPYNSYKLHSSSVKVADIIKPLHINQDLARYEVHRVWVVEATLRQGTRHIYPRRVFYLDEDSWQILVVDQYDARGDLWRVSEGFAINYYELPCLWTTMEVHTDLQAGRYLAVGMDNEKKPYDFARKFSPADFTPADLRREGVR
jgi:hypothetical protein